MKGETLSKHENFLTRPSRIVVMWKLGVVISAMIIFFLHSSVHNLNATKQNQYTKTFETRIGNLSTQFGYVPSETAKKLNDELFFQTDCPGLFTCTSSR